MGELFRHPHRAGASLRPEHSSTWLFFVQDLVNQSACPNRPYTAKLGAALRSHGGLIWPFGVNRRERDACDLARRVLVRVGRVRTGWGTRRAELEATMDHADIRGLVTALRRSVAGLPRSSVGDHRGSMPT